MTKTDIIPTYVYTEMTPNPASLKFVADRMVIADGGIAEFQSAENSQDSPLASKLFAFPFVSEVFIMSNFITITKTADADWDLIKNELREFVQKFLMQNQWAALKGTLQESEPVDRAQDEPPRPSVGHKISNEMEGRIAEILDEYVRPAVERDGGAIHLEGFSNGVVSVSLRGSCSGCPSATVTLKNGIETLLQSMVPEVQSVVAYEN